MKILHTSDWHLGQRLKDVQRDDEQQLALDWLIDTLDTHQIDILVVAGDIFDTPTPSNTSRNLYFNFLSRVVTTSCQHVVIVAGNHDSASQLQASKELLQHLNIHVKAVASPTPHQDILSLSLRSGEQLIVAAVPFLRDRDIIRSVALEAEQTRVERIQQGIIQHYQQLADALPPAAQHHPVLATGHLYAAGASTNNDKKDNIYLGNLENIRADQFPAAFDYIALGHIHKSQPIQERHIRYSGSLIPLSFKEAQEQKSATLLTFEGKTLGTIQAIKVPPFRSLVQISGDYRTVRERITQLDNAMDFPTMVAIELQVEAYNPTKEQEIRTWAEEHQLVVAHIRSITPQSEQQAWTQEDTRDLADLTVHEVFAAKCADSQLDEATTAQMTQAFNQLLTDLEAQQNA